MTRKDLRTYRYQKLRAAFLTDKTQCHWCGTTAARLTIDHVVPVALMHEGTGLTPLSVQNWVAACLRCNASRGAKLSALARQNRRPRRAAIGYAPPDGRSVGPSRIW